MEKIRVAICDDQADILDYFCDIINSQPDIEVVGTARNGREALEIAGTAKPDIVLMDIQMESESDGINAIEKISAKYPDVKSVVLTVHENDEMIISAYLAGAVDYIIKTTDEESFCQSIRNVYASGNYIGELITRKVRSEFSNMRTKQMSLLFVVNELSKLTATEIDIMKAVCNGIKQKEVARRNSIEISTVKFHVNNILKKLNFKNTRELAAALKRVGLLESDFMFLNKQD